LKHLNITCGDDVFQWLSEHPEINKSGLFQKVVSFMMEKQETVLKNTDLAEIVKQEASQ
jgi:hypothetical protein